MKMFRNVVNYENEYEVNDNGIVKSKDRRVNCGLKYQKTVLKKGKILKQSMRGGYYAVTLSKDNIKKTIFVHRLVAETFIPNPENKPQINHIDGNKLNNNVENLEWCTAKENITHSFETGLHSQESINNNVKAMNEARRKKIIQVKENKIINEFNSLVDAEKETKISLKNISSCLRKRSKTAGKYEWYFEGEC